MHEKFTLSSYTIHCSYTLDFRSSLTTRSTPFCSTLHCHFRLYILPPETPSVRTWKFYRMPCDLFLADISSKFCVSTLHFTVQYSVSIQRMAVLIYFSPISLCILVIFNSTYWVPWHSSLITYQSLNDIELLRISQYKYSGTCDVITVIFTCSERETIHYVGKKDFHRTIPHLVVKSWKIKLLGGEKKEILHSRSVLLFFSGLRREIIPYIGARFRSMFLERASCACKDHCV